MKFCQWCFDDECSDVVPVLSYDPSKGVVEQMVCHECAEKELFFLGWLNDCFVVLGHRGRVVQILAAGDAIELFIAGSWQKVTVCSGGYRGWYYETPDGARARFAVCMAVQVCSVPVEKNIGLGATNTQTDDEAFVRFCDLLDVPFPVCAIGTTFVNLKKGEGYEALAWEHSTVGAFLAL